VDLTPRTASLDGAGGPAADAPNASSGDGAVARRLRPSRPRRVRNVVLGLAVLGALGFVLVRGLGNAALFFYNVDEAVAKQQSLGDDRFRLQGSVEDGTIVREGDRATFTVTYNGVEARVAHVGEVPKMFEPGIPVVLEGRWQDGVFASDRMLVKHSEVYVADNPDRVAGYDEGVGEGVGEGEGSDAPPGAKAP
jgi:cytochrome c-type biogenesis protein CcmE